MRVKSCDSEPLQVQIRSSLHSVCSTYTYTNICIDLCGPKGCHPNGACEVYRFGRW